MAMRFVSDAWKESLSSNFVGAERIYIDFRRDDYLPVASTPTFTLVESTVESTGNQPGSHYLSGGDVKYLYTLPDKFTLEVRFKPQFVHTVATDQVIVQWCEEDSLTEFFKIFYDSASDKFIVYWKDGGTAQHLESQQFDDGTSHKDLDQWITLTIAIDLTTGDTTGSQLWINRTSQDTAWSGNIDSQTTNKVALDINTSESYDIAYMRFFSGLVATDTQVSNAFRDVTNEELYWNFDGNAIGRLRCNINRHVKSWSYSASTENDGGSQTANTMSMTLYNLAGQFSDDQYAAFDPTNDLFNGAEEQKYLRQRCGVFAESWYGTDFEPLFIGYLDTSGFPRNTRYDKYSEVSITAEDYVAQIANKFKDRPTYFEDKDLCNTSYEDESLLHLVSRLATQRTLYNYARNSSFDTAGLDSWDGTDARVTLSRDDTYKFCGSDYSGKAEFTGAGEFHQPLRFYDTNKEYASFGKELAAYPDADTTWTVSVWLRSDDFEGTLRLTPTNFSGGATTDISLSGGGWTQYTASYTFTADSEYIYFGIEADGAGTLYINGVTLRFGSTVYNGYVQNDDDTAMADFLNTDQIASESIDYVGIDAESVDVEHPWVFIKSKKPIWEEVKAIADAAAARYCGMDKAGTLRFKSAIAVGDSDPEILEEVTTTRDLSTTLETDSANKIIIHGVKILKDPALQLLWIWSASVSYLLDDKTVGDYLQVNVGANGYYPAEGSGEQLWAKYGSYGDEE